MYPEPVIKVSEEIYECFEEDLLKVFNERTPEWCKLNGIEGIYRFMLPKFLNSEELLIKENEVGILFAKCLAELGVASLKEKGLVDIIENEDGEEVIFLTGKGKKVAKKLKI